MPRPIEAYLIDPDTQTVQPVVIDGRDNLRDYYKLIDCECVDSVRIDRRNLIWVDDEGLLKGHPAPHGYFMVAGYPQPIAGRGVLTGITVGGKTVSSTFKLEQVEALVQFMSYPQVLKWCEDNEDNQLEESL